MASIGINTDLDFSAPTSTTPVIGASKLLKLLTASRVAVSNASGDLVASSVTATELGYLSGVTSSILTPPFADTQTIIKGSADATKLLRFEVDGFTTGQTRVLTPPDANIVIAGSASALTPGRIPYVTTGGLLIDTVDFIYNGDLGLYATGRIPSVVLVKQGVLSWSFGGDGTASNNFSFIFNSVKAVQLGTRYDMTIGNGAPIAGAQLAIYPLNASTITAIIRGAASQSANLTEWQNSSGTVLSGIDASGRFYAPTALTATTVGAAGGASALPATPTGYILVNVNGTQMKVPYFAT